MSGTDEMDQALDCYDQARLTNQARYYERRIQEYQRSATQTSITAQLLLLAAAVSGILGAVWENSTAGQAASLSAAGLAALAAAVAAWADVVGFAQNIELFSSARNGILNTRTRRPSPADATPAAVDDYVGRVEDILLGEVGAWGERFQSGGDPTL